MRSGTRWALTSSILLGLVVGGCECSEGEGVGRLQPKLELSDETLDFGEVPIGATKALSLTIANTGQTDLELMDFAVSVPFAVDVRVTQVEPGAQAVIDVLFTPENDMPQNAMLSIVSNDEETPTAVVALLGVGVPNVIEIQPATLDFTGTVVNTTRQAEVVVYNRGLEDVQGDLVAEGFLRPNHFEMTGLTSFDQRSPLGVAGRADAVLDVTYRPVDAGEDNGRIFFEYCGARCGSTVTVTASALESVVRIDPSAVDFGAVGIGVTETRQVLVYNDGEQPLEVSQALISGAPEVAARPGLALPTVVPPGGNLQIALDYVPRAATTMSGELSVRTNDPGVPEARIRLTGRGEGPLFTVQPSELNFGVLNQLVTAKRALLLTNAGSSQVRVLSFSVSGDPAFEVTPEDLPGLPTALGSGESITPSLSFTPTDVREYRATVTITTDDPNAPNVEVPVVGGYAERTCELDASPARLNFGLIPEDYQRTLPVTIQNVGASNCVITSAAFREPVDPAFLAGGAAWPLTLTPGQQATLQFTYDPFDFRESKATYVMTTDDPVFPERLIALVGSSLQYDDILVQPPAVDFGERGTTCAASGQRAVTLFNVGTVNHIVEQVVLTSTSSDLTVMPPALPGPLNAGAFVEIPVRYVPSDLGLDRGELEIHLLNRGYPIIVPMKGLGSDFPRITDVFTQVSSRLVDVLFVVDDSCSMNDEQDELATNFASFIATANLRQVDFQIGVTTTTIRPGTGGLLVGPVLTNTTPNLEAEFAAQANVGVRGSGYEQGLEGMAGAFLQARSGVSPNRDLFRQLAALVVVLISDEDDQSPASPVTYLSELLNAAPSGYTVAAVTGELSGCRGASTLAAAAPKYAQFLSLTGGISESICSNNWSQTLGNIGSAAFGLRTRFLLTEPIDQSQPVDVLVDGVPTTGWTYDPVGKSIVFDSASVPAENSAISVTYRPGC